MQPFEIADLRGKIRRFAVQTHEGQAVQFGRAERDQSIVRPVEPGGILHVRHTGERPIEFVSPAVERAPDAPAIARPVQQPRPAMPAGIGKRPQLAIRVAQHNQRHPRQLQRLVIPRPGKPPAMANPNPLASENPRNLDRQNRVIPIAPRRQTPRHLRRCHAGFQLSGDSFANRRQVCGVNTVEH